MFEKNSVFNFKLFFTTSVMAFQQFVIGGVFGYSAIILPQLQRSDALVHVDGDQASWIACLPLLLCPVGSMLFGFLSDRFGRKYSLQLTYIPLLLSWTLLSNAHSLNDIYIGRLLAGLATGTGGVVYVYIAETSPTCSRPFYLLIYTLFVGLGMMTAAALGAAFHWRTVAAAFGASCAIGFAAPFLVPATPMWLRSRGRDEEARRAEEWFGFVLPRGAIADATADAAAEAGPGPVESVAGRDAAGRWAAYARPTVWKPALIALAFFVCQQASGFYTLLFYSVDVLRDCRVPVDGMTAAVYLSAARLVGTAVNLAFQSAPKRLLTVVSGLGMCASLSTVVGYMYAYGDVPDPPAGGLLLAAFLLYVFFAMFAVLPLPWSVCGEMFPMSVKGTANGVLHSCGYELMFVKIKVYPLLVDTFGIRAVWTVYAASCFVTALFGVFVLPETTGKTLDEISDGFESRKSAKPRIP